jgi:hypothetical protein
MQGGMSRHISQCTKNQSAVNKSASHVKAVPFDAMQNMHATLKNAYWQLNQTGEWAFS